MLKNLPSDAGGWLLHPHQGAVSKIAFHKKHHLIISHEHFAAADVVEPPLHGSLDPCFIFICSSTGGRQGGRNRWHKSLGVSRYQVVGELAKLRV